MATVDVELNLVRRFHALCEPYDARPSITRRNTLPTLIRFLDSNDREIRRLSLQSIYLLVQHPSCVGVLARNDKLRESLDSLLHDARYDDPELCDVATRTLHCVDMHRLEQAEMEFGSSARVPSADEVRGHVESGTSTRPASHSDLGQNSFIEEVCAEVSSNTSVDKVALSAANTGAKADQSEKLGDAADRSPGTRSRLRRCSSFSSTAWTNSDCGDGNARTGKHEPSRGFGGAARRDTMRTAHGLSSSSYDTPHRRGEQDDRSVVSSNNSFASRVATRELPLLVTMDIPALNSRSDTSLLERILQDARGVVSYNILASSHQVRVFMNARTEKMLQNSLLNVGYANMIINVEQMTVASDCYNSSNFSRNDSFRGGSDSSRSNIFAGNTYPSHARSSGMGSYFDKENGVPSYAQSVKSFATGLYGALTVFGGSGDQSPGPLSGQRPSLADKQSGTSATDRIVKAIQRWW